MTESLVGKRLNISIPDDAWDDIHRMMAEHSTGTVSMTVTGVERRCRDCGATAFGSLNLCADCLGKAMGLT